MKSDSQVIKLLIICSVLGAVFGAIAGFAASRYISPSSNELISSFYSSEHAASVSPSDYVRDLVNGKQDGLVVDLRNPDEYNAGHLVTSVNIPAEQLSPTQVLSEFKALPKDKPIITYCYSQYCMLSRNVGNYLAQNNFYAMHMTAGWAEISRDFSNYVVTGTQAGSLSAVTNQSGGTCSLAISSFGC